MIEARRRNNQNENPADASQRGFLVLKFALVIQPECKKLQDETNNQRSKHQLHDTKKQSKHLLSGAFLFSLILRYDASKTSDS